MLRVEAELGVFRELQVSLVSGGHKSRPGMAAWGAWAEGGGSHGRFGVEEKGDLTQVFTGSLWLQSGRER